VTKGFDYGFPVDTSTGTFSKFGQYTATDGAFSMKLTEVAFPSLARVAEPSTWAMILLGFAGLRFVGYRQTRKAKPQAA
jgi:hypothetical protein